MRSRHAALAVFIAILLAFFVRHNMHKQDEGSGAPAESLPEPAQSVASTPSPSPTLASPGISLSPSPRVTLNAGPLEFPTLKEVREQVAQDPHQTPAALIEFAKNLSAHAEAAKGSPDSAQEFFGVLENCLSNGKDPSESVPIPAQLTCLTTAEEFAKLYPNELGSRLKPLQENTSPELKRIREALNKF